MLRHKRWDPFTELSTLHGDMEEFFKRTFGSVVPGLSKWTVPYLAVESFFKGGKLFIRADMPGIIPDDIDISIVGNQLSIKAVREEVQKEEGSEYLFEETCYGKCERTITLPEGVDVDNIHATSENGVLELTLPAMEAALPKKVTIEKKGVGKVIKKAA